jgi:hypothetical protein
VNGGFAECNKRVTHNQQFFVCIAQLAGKSGHKKADADAFGIVLNKYVRAIGVIIKPTPASFKMIVELSFGYINGRAQVNLR